MSTRFNFENHPGYEKLKEAFSRSNRDFLNSIELVPEEDVYFSSRYEKKMAHLIKRQKRPYWKYVNTVGKRIAVIAIAFMMLFGLSMSIKAVRESVVSFVVTIFDKFSELFVDKSEIKNAPDIIEEVYTLTDVPEGYVQFDDNISKHKVVTVWKKDDRELVFTQMILKSISTVDNETTNQHSIFLGNIEILYSYRKEETYQYTQAYWRTDSYWFSINIDEYVSESDMLNYIQSVKIE